MSSTTNTISSSSDLRPTSPPMMMTSTTPSFGGDLRINDKAAKEFSQNIGKVVNLAHLVPSLSAICQKFQLEQAAAAVSFERLSPGTEKEKAKETHFVDGLKRGFDFCLNAAKAALNEALTRGVPNLPKRGDSMNSTNSDGITNNNNNFESSTAGNINNMESSTNSAASSSTFTQQGMASYNSCEDISATSPASSTSITNVVNEHVIQCIAELSYYSIEVLQQTFLVSGNPKISAHLRDYAVSQKVSVPASAHSISGIAAAAAAAAASPSPAEEATTMTSDKLTEYIRAAFSTSREIELSWFAEGFRTSHMNLLCNVLFDSPAACRAVLACEGLIMLILFHGKHLDPENPGLNEWSAFAMRTITGVVPEAGAMIQEMKKKAQELSSEKRKEQEDEEKKMRDAMRSKEQEFM